MRSALNGVSSAAELRSSSYDIHEFGTNRVNVQALGHTVVNDMTTERQTVVGVRSS